MTSTTSAIRSNHKALFVESSGLLEHPEALRDRAAQNGYLFFKQFLPKTDVLALRAEMLSVVGYYGWRQAGQDALGGLIDVAALSKMPDEKMRTDIGVSISAYHDVQKLEAFHRLPHHPLLLSLYRLLLGKEILVHPRHIARMITAHPSVFPTPPHQDFPLIQGTPNTWTCWIPIGDCPRPLGGLTILKGSHRNGYLPIQPAKGAGGIAVPLCPYEVEWVEGDFEAGDILTFPSYTIHKALRCQWKDHIRLSMDVRFQAIDEPVEAKSLLPHCDLTWEQIYANWEQDDLKYYWQKLPLELTPWEDSYLQPKRRIC
jgi:ectoine hydroxylase-related dioxygenase (phytanoyl-CoA dioxygenase family)